ncbi:hypothetical protein LINPERPRIM_LOCUS996 [Linum perenne]
MSAAELTAEMRLKRGIVHSGHYGAQETVEGVIRLREELLKRQMWKIRRRICRGLKLYHQRCNKVMEHEGGALNNNNHCYLKSTYTRDRFGCQTGTGDRAGR